MTPIGKMIVGFYLVAAMIATGLLSYSFTNETTVNKIDDSMLFSRFSSREELTAFFEKGSSQSSGYGNYAPTLSEDRSLSGSNQYSNTNVQVAGVDELDSVKTDGRFIYVSSNAGVNILRAYPPSELANLTFIPTRSLVPEAADSVSAYTQGIFVQGERLIVVSSWYQTPLHETYSLASTSLGPWTTVSVLDMNDPTDPVLLHSAGVSGWPVTARFTDGTVYLVTNAFAITVDNETHVPLISVDGIKRDFPLEAIRYDPEMDDPSAFTNLLALNISDLEENAISIVTGYSSIIYASRQAIYLTVTKSRTTWSEPFVRPESSDEDTTTTTIYKVAYDGLSMGATASGSVRGSPNDQFSIDEWGSYLRIATTSGWPNPSSAVFVLNEELVQIGVLDQIAVGERIYSSRFVGETLYLVTFRQIDPLFIIDLSLPSSPRIVSELTLPGFSTYLHPIDEDHILGIGAEDGVAKISLFDVSIKSAPKETSKWVLENYDWSSIVYDHKEVLFDAERNLLVLPITASGQYIGDHYEYLSGAFVFRVSTDDGIALRGVIRFNDTYYWGGVQRSLYIGDYLYTIRGSTMKVNLLSDLSEVASLEFFTYSWGPYRVMT